jgi:hypothetical protein
VHITVKKKNGLEAKNTYGTATPLLNARRSFSDFSPLFIGEVFAHGGQPKPDKRSEDSAMS